MAAETEAGGAPITEAPVVDTSVTDSGTTDKGTGVTENQSKGEAGKTEAKVGDKPTDKAAEQPVVPEKYDLKVPEGVLVDEQMMKDFTDLGKEQKWSNEQAQKMIDMHIKALGGFASKQDADHVAQLEGWSKELKTDKEIGGAKIDEAIGQARRVMKLAATVPGVNMDRLNADLNRTGLATHPDLVRLFHYFGQFIGEDNKFIKGNAPSGEPKSQAEILYGPSGVRS